MCKFGCGTGNGNGCVRWMGDRCGNMDMPPGRPYAVAIPKPVAVDSAGASASVGESIPLIIISSAFVLGSIMSLAASTLLIFFSPFSTSPFALLYIHNPKNVITIPIPCIGCTLWLNHTIAIQITATRLMSDAIEYVTGEVEERITNAIIF